MGSIQNYVLVRERSRKTMHVIQTAFLPWTATVTNTAQNRDIQTACHCSMFTLHVQIISKAQLALQQSIPAGFIMPCYMSRWLFEIVLNCLSPGINTSSKAVEAAPQRLIAGPQRLIAGPRH